MSEEEGRKDDKEKPPIFTGVIVQFPRAMAELASLSAFGADKYAWGNWRNVGDGFGRYSDAMVRHIVKEGQGEVLDPEHGFHHATSTAWNSLARLEILLTEEASGNT